MRISKKELIKLLREAIETALQEAPVTIDQVASNVNLCLFVDINNRYHEFTLLDISAARREGVKELKRLLQEDEDLPSERILVEAITDRLRIVGNLAIKFNKDCNIFVVNHSTAIKGYGPLMYDIAMSHANSLGYGMTSDRSIVRPAAINVWKQYFARNDVEKVKIDNQTCQNTRSPEDDQEFNALNAAYFIQNKVSTDLLKTNWENFQKLIFDEVSAVAVDEYVADFQEQWNKVISDLGFDVMFTSVYDNGVSPDVAGKGKKYTELTQ